MSLAPTTFTVLIGSIGGLLASVIGFPAPFLTGPATIVTILCLMGIKCSVSVIIRNVSFIIIGISIGSSVTPQLAETAVSWPLTIIGMIANVLVIIIIGRYFFGKLLRLDSNTAFLASCPGLLSFVLSLSEDTKSNTAMISVIQSVRILTLTLAIPAFIAVLTDFDSQPLSATMEKISFFNLLFLLITSLLFGVILLQIKVPAAFLLAGMFLSTLGHSLDLTPGIMPHFLATFAFIVLGSLVGSRFSEVKLDLFQATFLKGAAFTVVALLVSIFFSFSVSLLSEYRFIDLLIAFAPGGLETMAAMGAIVKADTTFVAVHHLARLFLLTALIPLVIKKG